MPPASGGEGGENRTVRNQIVYPVESEADAAKPDVFERLTSLEPDTSGLQPVPVTLLARCVAELAPFQVRFWHGLKTRATSEASAARP
jgi:hypothetical protein